MLKRHDGLLVSSDEEPQRKHCGVSPQVPASWSSDDVEALEGWGQGCLLRGSIMGWAIPDRVLPDASDTTKPSYVEPDVRFIAEASEWSVITSQTCDVAAQGPGAQHPYVQVSPLVNLDLLREATRLDCQSWSITYLAPIERHPDGGEWAADLRISMPISKKLLLATKPIFAFTDDGHLGRFSNHISRRLGRPAYHDGLSTFATVITTEIEDSKKARNVTWFESVEQVRLEIYGSRLAPQSVSLHVICIEKLTTTDKDKWRELKRRFTKVLRPVGASFGRFSFHELDKVSVRDYRDWHPLYVKGLQDRHYW